MPSTPENTQDGSSRTTTSQMILTISDPISEATMKLTITVDRPGEFPRVRFLEDGFVIYYSIGDARRTVYEEDDTTEISGRRGDGPRAEAPRNPPILNTLSTPWEYCSSPCQSRTCDLFEFPWLDNPLLEDGIVIDNSTGLFFCKRKPDGSFTAMKGDLSTGLWEALPVYSPSNPSDDCKDWPAFLQRLIDPDTRCRCLHPPRFAKIMDPSGTVLS